MRKSKLGDVYSVKVPNGYKIIQWAYQIEKYGRFIRVFDGLYEALPLNISEMIEGDHSYITELFVGRAYRIGLLQYLGNYPVPAKYPFPESQIEFCSNRSGIYGLRIKQQRNADIYMHYSDTTITTIAALHEQYHDVKRLAHYISPDWLLYLFDNNFSMYRLNIFYPWIYWGDDWKGKYQVYIDIVNNAKDNNRTSRKKLQSSE